MITATLPYVAGWLAATVAVLAAPLLLVLPVTPLLDRWHAWRKLRASRVAVPVTGEHMAYSYACTRAMARGVKLVTA